MNGLPRHVMRFRLGIAGVVIAAAALGVWMLSRTSQVGSVGLNDVLQVLVGWSFVACGVYLWVRRSTNRLGPLMSGVGFLWLSGRAMQLVDDPVVYPLGLWLTDLWAVAFAWFLLSFPNGRRLSRPDFAVLGVFLFVTVPLELAWFVFLVPENGMNAFGLLPDPAGADLVDRIQRVVIAAGAVALVLVVGRRWLRSSGLGRQQITPALAGSVAILVQVTEWIFFSSGTSPDLLNIAIRVTQIVIPVAVLWLLLETRLARGAVADLVVELGRTPTPARLRDALANGLGDPSLRVAYWASEGNRFVDSRGQAVELPAFGSSQAVTMLEREGVREAAIIHDSALLDDPGLMMAVSSALRLAVENERLNATVEEQLAEVRASRARIVSAGDAERRRVERDLHDGAQQRLVSLSLALRLARNRLGESAEPALRESLDHAAEEARAALAELRDLARGIHPMVLTEAGLGPAIDSLARRATVDVSVDVPEGRYPSAVEGAAYFVVSEALANIAKHAQATKASISVRTAADHVNIEITDDGIGGANAGSGSGLRGLVDRLAAVDGTLTISSPAGAGTRLFAEIPFIQPAQMPG